jgi:TolB-like protein/DNA-binding winged helix-turn-helix (wHTH) protein/Flp pilus assembly protein TadD
MVKQATLTIDGWWIDSESNRITRHGVEKKLEPRAMELLVYLARQAGQVVPRAEIEEQVWQGRVVGYEALSGSIAKIRKAFDDDARQHRVIETIPKSGYRLIARVSRADPATVDNAAGGDSVPIVSNRSKPFIFVVLLVSITLAPGWWQGWSERVEPVPIDAATLALPDKPSLAVLPFTNMSGLAGQEYFVDGLSDDLITDLSQNPELFVISRNSTFFYKDKTVSIRQVARELGVRYVMEGSVQREGDRVRINAQLIDGATDGHVWSERYDGTLDDLFGMRDQITGHIAAALSVRLTPPDSAAIEIASSAVDMQTDTEAYDALLRGREHYRLMTPGDLVKAIEYLDKAIEIDPDFAAAHAHLAASYWGICNNGWAEVAEMSYEECGSETTLHLAQAMKDPTPLAHRIAARQHEYYRRWDEALVEAGKAIDLDPNDPNGHVAMSALLVNQDRAAEGLESVQRAMRLDPQTDYLWRLGYAQFHLERYQDAAATLLRGTRRNPEFDWNYLLLGAAYGHLGREAEAREAVQQFNLLRQAKTGKKRPFTLLDLQYWSIKNEAGLERLRRGMIRAGVPVD